MVLSFDKALYSKIALLKTAYSFTDLVYIQLQQDENSWHVEWVPKREGVNLDSRAFENELIAQSLREEVNTQTQDLRKMILARAMASTLIEENAPIDDFAKEETDQEKILSGWFDLHHE